MSREPHYVVVDIARAGGRLLALDGVFAYPVWVDTIEKVTPMSFVRAHDFAAAYGGVVVPLSAEPVEEARRIALLGQTAREPERVSVPLPWGFVG